MNTIAQRIGGTALAVFLCTSLLAQQDPQFTQYMFNLLALNPAYAGSEERVSLKALSRHQWVGFEGAPTTQTLTVHSPLGHESLGLGGTIMRDSHGPITQYTFMADFAYRIFMGDAKLAFGLKGGLNLFQGQFAELNPLVAGDQVFQQNVSTKLDPQFGFGMMYYSDRYFLGLSTPKLVRTEFFDTDSLAFVSSPGQRAHYFLTGGYVFDLGTYHKFKPTFLVKAVNGAPLSFDLSANFLFFEKFWLGAMYRHTDAVGALAQYHITNDFTVGYSYDYPLSTLRNYSGGSHEIMLGFAFGNKLKGIRSPRYF
ncbi:MAG: type IX secretion system membrane protein PorP/SprF [Flavobacteriales bacterium]|jgi:type IX secretion system PorP/SprF family membrane protein|nr:type IX secretion system membrane protein PorP/SprF [Flavobacteriales bacterium]MBK6550001.1 type IX secretion system membrane protein PorP/SprF [Flavobacteriales bacterium]MBK6881836.1 type IX secretion system membrane protein PorP/SprF [Flavobacteriales bacterium]MBK7102511.1 type IX secretion system membrane protein PorP/SprF [Flavobacteriales bacterium]MBK7113245.1 type IX secretion system membrane protein PorP/SprF [Flavobacteriales bacterium]